MISDPKYSFQWFKNNFLLSHPKLLFFTRFYLHILIYIFLCYKKFQFNQDIIAGTTITSPVNISSTSIENVIWSPNYPNSYDGNFSQVTHSTSTCQNIPCIFYPLRRYYYTSIPILQEWILQSTNGQSVTLTFNSFDVGTGEWIS